MLVIIRLSYPITQTTPLYPGTDPVGIHRHRSIRNGDSANTHTVAFQNHTGTHIDVPYHFCEEGATVAGCLGAEAIFSPAYCIGVSAEGDMPVGAEDLLPLMRECGDSEAILLKTGGAACRQSDPERYAGNHPYISPDIPAQIRGMCRKLRLFGIDQISVSSVLHREEGRQCHREFLCRKPSVLLLEDLDLSDARLSSHGFRLMVYPHVVAGIDGTPVTALADLGP